MSKTKLMKELKGDHKVKIKKETEWSTELEIFEYVSCPKIQRKVDWQTTCMHSDDRDKDCKYFGGRGRIGVECKF
jgi:hypothetical protein